MTVLSIPQFIETSNGLTLWSVHDICLGKFDTFSKIKGKSKNSPCIFIRMGPRDPFKTSGGPVIRFFLVDINGWRLCLCILPGGEMRKLFYTFFKAVSFTCQHSDWSMWQSSQTKSVKTFMFNSHCSLSPVLKRTNKCCLLVKLKLLCHDIIFL